MPHTIRPFVHLAVDAVDLVVADPEERYDADHFDRYQTFESARDAALTSVEVMLDEKDFDDESHRLDLELVREMLETAQEYGDLLGKADYHRFLSAIPHQESAA